VREVDGAAPREIAAGDVLYVEPGIVADWEVDRECGLPARYSAMMCTWSIVAAS
jgi:hypothetical protein